MAMPIQMRDVDGLPDALTARDQWVCWRREDRDGKATKVPVEPSTDGYASTTDGSTWTSVETALASTEDADVDGIGFVFTDDDPIVGVDLDDCRDPDSGKIDEWARDVVTRLDSYTEVSPSGTGVHVIVEGELPEGRSRSGDVEMYETSRFFTVTGEHLDATPNTVERPDDAIRDIHADYVQDRPADDADAEEAAPAGTDGENVDLDDSELLERARAAENGDRFDALWRGQTRGYDSHSEADMALCMHLAFWTGGDAARMDSLFRQSGLMGEKWDEVHYADGSTYGEKTIERAIANTSEFYDPSSSDDADDDRSTSGEVSTEVGREETDRGHAYLTEKTRLLTARVTELEETLARKNERIDALEAEIERLEEAHAIRGREPGQPKDAHPGDAAEDDDEAGEASVWGRTKRWLGSDAT
ncbi:MAG: hypothetical protein PPP55_08415 [Halorubrum sp.]